MDAQTQWTCLQHNSHSHGSGDIMEEETRKTVGDKGQVCCETVSPRNDSDNKQKMETKIYNQKTNKAEKAK